MAVESNVIEYGPDTRGTMPVGNFKGPVEVFWKGNKIISKVAAKELSGSYTLVEKRPVWPQGLVSMPADDVKEWILNNAGAFPWERDEIDKRIIAGVKAGTGRIINSEKEVGDYPGFKPVFKKFNVDEWDMVSLTKKADKQKKVTIQQQRK